MTPTRRQAFWRANLKLVGVLLFLWATVSFGFGILLKDWLDTWSLGGYPLGFWFAQQGSIFSFVVLIAIYGWQMNRLEKRFGVTEGDPADDPADGHQ